MEIIISPVNFCYKSILKDEFKRGRIKLKNDITGRPINKQNVTLDHTVPRARGGKSTLDNYSLMSIESNHNRGTEPLSKFIDLPSLIDYILVMMDVDLEGIHGIDYIKEWLKNLRKEI